MSSSCLSGKSIVGSILDPTEMSEFDASIIPDSDRLIGLHGDPINRSEDMSFRACRRRSLLFVMTENWLLDEHRENERNDGSVSTMAINL